MEPILLGALLALSLSISVLLLYLYLGIRKRILYKVRQSKEELARAIAESSAERSRLESSLHAETLRAEQAKRKEDRLSREILRWQKAALGPYLLSQSLPIYPDRPCLLEFDALVARLRGAAFVETVVLADRVGLPLAREDNEEAQALARVAPLLGDFTERVHLAEGDLFGVNLLTDGLRHVSARPLPSQLTQAGTWLLASASGQPPSPIAMDMAVSGALVFLRGQEPENKPSPILSGQNLSYAGTSKGAHDLLSELSQALSATPARALCLFQNATLIAAQGKNGPSAEDCELLGRALCELRGTLAFALRAEDILRMDFTIAGLSLTHVVLSQHSPYSLLILCPGIPIAEMQVAAILGRLQRFLNLRPAQDAHDFTRNTSVLKRRTVHG